MCKVLCRVCDNGRVKGRVLYSAFIRQGGRTVEYHAKYCAEYCSEYCVEYCAEYCSEYCTEYCAESVYSTVDAKITFSMIKRQSIMLLYNDYYFLSPQSQ